MSEDRPTGPDRFVVDRSWTRPEHGDVVVAGSPLRLFRLGPAGVRVVEAIERGEPCPSGHEPLTDRLVDAGAVHPLPGPARAYGAGEVTAVIPVHDEDRAVLAALVGRLGALGEVVVVDDASTEPVGELAGARVVRLHRNRGPAAARNAALGAVRTAVALFLDADTEPPDGDWLGPLLAHLDDERVGLVAPRVLSVGAPGVLGAFDAARSPLDLGPHPARIRPGTRVSYVPAAALLVRLEALASIGGFDEALRYGEDVDLVWRLVEAGWACRYEPAVSVGHRPRRNLAAFARQRYSYGTSAAPLARRHPGALAPARVSGWSAAVWGFAATGHPLVAVTTAAATTAALARRLRNVPRPWRLALRFAGLGHVFAGRTLAAAVTRAWWPIAAVVAVRGSRRARLVVTAAALVPALVDWRERRPGVDPLRYTALALLDDAAYGWGLWRGCLTEGEIGPLLPELASWPRTPQTHNSPSKPRLQSQRRSTTATSEAPIRSTPTTR